MIKSSLIAFLWRVKISWTTLLVVNISLSCFKRAASASWLLRANIFESISNPYFAVALLRWFVLPRAWSSSFLKSLVFIVIWWTAYANILALFYAALSVPNSDIEWSMILARVISSGLWSGLENSLSTSLEEMSSRTRSSKIKVRTSVYCESKAAV